LGPGNAPRVPKLPSRTTPPSSGCAKTVNNATMPGRNK
jgi:hypothetical protein